MVEVVIRNACYGLDWGADQGTSELVMSNSTITGNGGSGLRLDNRSDATPQVRIESTTIADNGGPQITIVDGPDGYPLDLTVRNSIVSGTPEMALTPLLADSLTSSYSLWNGVSPDFAAFLATSGAGNLDNVDPLLGPLADNGGFTPTRAPAATSPIIDAGDPSAVSYAPDRDQRDQTRIVAVIDMGSVEVGTRAATGAAPMTMTTPDRAAPDRTPRWPVRSVSRAISCQPPVLEPRPSSSCSASAHCSWVRCSWPGLDDFGSDDGCNAATVENLHRRRAPNERYLCYVTETAGACVTPPNVGRETQVPGSVTILLVAKVAERAVPVVISPQAEPHGCT